MTKRLHYTLTLIDDVIVSANNATVGGYKTEHYIRGYLMLGITASKLYQSLGAMAGTVFHAGKVRFTNALPQSDTKITLPTPGHLQRDKDDKKNLYDMFYEEAREKDEKDEKDKNLKSIKKPFITFIDDSVNNKIELFNPSTSQQLKTAIDPETRTADKGRLFSYEALQAGQCFRGSIDIDDDVLAHQPDLIEQLKSALSGTLRLGRSRSAQYGRVHCEFDEATNTLNGTVNDDSITLLALSDLVLLNSLGRPTTSPSLKELGIHYPGDDVQLESKKSAISHGQYSPWNGVRRRFDRARTVIKQGSVLSWPIPAGVKSSDLNNLLQQVLDQGVGLYRESGHGQLCLMPDCLIDKDQYPLFTGDDGDDKSDLLTPEQALEKLAATGPFGQWLIARRDDALGKDTNSKATEQLVKDIVSLYAKGHRYLGNNWQAVSQSFGPGKSQWGRIMDIGRGHTQDTTIESIINNNDPAWNGLVDPENNTEKTFGEAVTVLLKEGNDAVLRQAARQLAAMADQLQHYDKATYNRVLQGGQR